MVMSVGICECRCSEFGHDVGGFWEELSEPDYEGWQQHRCTKQCLTPCLVARCRDGFDGDGFWVWCRDCDIQCSGSFESWSDEPDQDIDEDLVFSEKSLPADTAWPPAIGAKIEVNFSAEELVVVEWIELNEEGDPRRSTTSEMKAWPNTVYALYCQRANGELVLIEPLDLG